MFQLSDHQQVLGTWRKYEEKLHAAGPAPKAKLLLNNPQHFYHKKEIKQIHNILKGLIKKACSQALLLCMRNWSQHLLQKDQESDIPPQGCYQRSLAGEELQAPGSPTGAPLSPGAEPQGRSLGAVVRQSPAISEIQPKKRKMTAQ